MDGHVQAIIPALAGRHLPAAEGKALADFVAGTCGTEEAFVQEELLGDKPGEVWLMADCGFEFEDSLALALALATGESDMGLVGTSLGDEPAKPCGLGDAPLQQEQFGRDPDGNDEYPGPLEETQPFKLYADRRQAQFTQSRDNAVVFLAAGIAQKLQRNVPGFGSRPAEPVPIRLKPRHSRREFADDCGRQGYPNKEAHTETMVSALFAPWGIQEQALRVRPAFPQGLKPSHFVGCLRHG